MLILDSPDTAAKIHDRSLDKTYRSAAADVDDEEQGKGVEVGRNAFADISDFNNEDFLYSY